MGSRFEVAEWKFLGKEFGYVGPRYDWVYFYSGNTWRGLALAVVKSQVKIWRKKIDCYKIEMRGKAK